MNWDAFAAIVEAIGALGVVLSVVYLANQIKAQTLEAQLAATRDLARLQSELSESMVSDPSTLEVYMRGVNDYGLLNESERLIFGLTISRGMRLHEQAFLHSKHKNLHLSFYESLRSRLGEQMSRPGIVEWWNLNQNAFSEEFRNYIKNGFSWSSEENGGP